MYSDAELMVMAIDERNAALDDEYWDAYGQAEADAERAVELAAERYLEDAGWQEAEFQDEMEARAGVIPWEVARDWAGLR